jgi:YggT family protein
MAIFQVVQFALSIYQFILIARVLMSWIPDLDRSHPIAQFLHNATEPLLRPIREALPMSAGGMDFSPLILFLGIYLLQILLPR